MRRLLDIISFVIALPASSTTLAALVMLVTGETAEIGGTHVTGVELLLVSLPGLVLLGLPWLNSKAPQAASQHPAEASPQGAPVKSTALDDRVPAPRFVIAKRTLLGLAVLLALSPVGFFAVERYAPQVTEKRINELSGRLDTHRTEGEPDEGTFGQQAIAIPPPFHIYTPIELIRPLYPHFDAQAGVLGAPATSDPTSWGTRDLDETSRELLHPRRIADRATLCGYLYDARMWKGEGKPQLLAMVEANEPTEKGECPGYQIGAATHPIDLALFEIRDGKLVLVAKLYDATERGGHSWKRFDLAPYAVKPGLLVIGIRDDYMHMGAFTSTLTLFLRSGSAFRPIFERAMADGMNLYSKSVTGEPSQEEIQDALSSSGDADWEQGRDPFATKAVLEVVPKKDSYNDFRIVERRFGLARDGTLSRQPIVVETWSWDPAREIYIKRDTKEKPN